LEILFRSWARLPVAPNYVFTTARRFTATNTPARTHARQGRRTRDTYGSETRKSTINANEIKQELDLQHLEVLPSPVPVRTKALECRKNTGIEKIGMDKTQE
jgi:hypothetical protein